MRGTVHLPNQAMPIAVDVRVGSGRVQAIEGERLWEIGLDEVKIEPGGFEADFVFCRPPDASFTIAVNDPAFVTELGAIADDRLRGELAKVRVHRRSHHTWRWIGIGTVVVSAILIGVALYSVPRMLAASIDAVPISVDRELGDAAIAQVELEGEEVEDPVVRGCVEEIVARLAPHAAIDGFEFRVRVIESEQVNAFALPGGQMVVFTGLLERAHGPEEVAGVLAHEMAHVTKRHGLRNVAHQAGIMLGISLLLGDASGWVELASDVAILAQSNDYSREQESGADEEGVRMLMAAGLDPHGLADFFRLLQEEPGSEIAGAMTWISTHPDHRSRVAHIERLMRTFPSAPRRPLTTDWAAVQRALAAR